MLSKKINTKLIHIIYWSIILFLTVKGVFFELLEEVTIEQIGTVEMEVLLLIFAVMLIFSIIMCFPLTVMYIGGIIAVKVFYKSKLDITDKKTDLYFRELLSNNTIATLGYIRDLKINENDLAATIMSLELKGKIKIEKEIGVVDASLDNLDKSEAYILEKIKKNDCKNIDFNLYEKEIISDCIKNNLLVAKEGYKKYFIRKAIAFGIFYAIIMLLFNTLPSISNVIFGTILNVGNIVVAILMITIFMSLIISPGVFFVSEIVNLLLLFSNPYIRSKKAKEINEKLNGLENYLKDFSMIKSREIEEIKLWKEYLIYSVIFGMNNDIRDEIIGKLR